MRTKLLVLLACASAALGTALVVLPATTATAAGDPPLWELCTTAAQEYCIESAAVKGGSAVTPGPTPASNRDFPWFKGFASEHSMVFGIYHDVNGSGTNLTYDVDPTKTYVLVVRTGTFRPREMNATATNGDFSVGGNATSGWKATIQWQPTNVHHVSAISCSFDGGCGTASTKADNEDPFYGVGSIEDLIGSGLSSREIYARQGMFTVTNAQNTYPFYDLDTATLEIRMANPHLDQSGNPVIDGTYDGFIPNAYLIMMGVPEPSALTKSSFIVTKSVDGTTTTAPFTFISEPGGVRIKFSGISFSRPTFKVRIKPTVPGKPRLYDVVKTTRTTAKSKFYAPIANGNRRIDRYQARCHAAGRAWHYKYGTKSPITVGSLPRGAVYCQVRAHNVKGWGRWSAALRN